MIWEETSRASELSLIVINNCNTKHLSHIKNTFRCRLFMISLPLPLFQFLYYCPKAEQNLKPLSFTTPALNMFVLCFTTLIFPTLTLSPYLHPWSKLRFLKLLLLLPCYSYLAPPFILFYSSKVRLPFSKFSEPSFTLIWFRLSWFSISLALKIGPSCWWSTKWLPKKETRNTSECCYCSFTVTVNADQFSYSFKFTWKRSSDLQYLFFWLLLGISAFVLLLLSNPSKRSPWIEGALNCKS